MNRRGRAQPAPARVGRRLDTRVAGLVLAAGAGSRFGAPKALAELDGERLVDRATRMLRVGGCDPVLVVLGAAVVPVPGADIVVVNTDWTDGVGSSLRTGLDAAASAAGTACTAVVIVLVDQPGLRADAVRRVLAAHAAGAQLAVAAYGDAAPAPGSHPVLIGRQHWAGVADLARGDSGARAYLTQHADAVVRVDCTGQGDPTDADTPAELTGRGVLGRIAGGASTAGGSGLAAGLGELGALLGGAAARAALDEQTVASTRRQTQAQGEPPFDVDLAAGVARLRRRPPPPG